LKNIPETITQVGILEQHSTNGGLSQFMTVSRVIRECCEEKSCRWSVCVRACMCACVCSVSNKTKLRHNSTNPEAGISYANLGPETEK